jgi:prepilin-type N-terminal cleavage/methylation domain-containing protein
VIRNLIRDERGQMTLIELLVAMSIFGLVLGATLFTFMTFDTLERRTVDRTSSQDSARTSVDRLVRNLRNLASPTIAVPQAVDRALPYDLAFQTVDSVGPNTGANAANVKRVRWCLNQATPSNEKLYVQEQKWVTQDAPTIPADTNCPGSGWDTATVMASNLTNTYQNQSRPLFTYNSSILTQINSIHVDLYTDIDPVRAPSETHLTSGVFLRNQNQVPVASFAKALSGTTAIVLNGSASYDPESQSLTYQWWDNGAKIDKGDGIVYTYKVTPGSSHALQLKVYDPAKLEGVSAIQNVTVPGG